jgi:hypothetical protein
LHPAAAPRKVKVERGKEVEGERRKGVKRKRRKGVKGTYVLNRQVTSSAS